MVKRDYPSFFPSVEKGNVAGNVKGYVLENVLYRVDEESLDGLEDDLIEKLIKRFRF